MTKPRDCVCEGSKRRLGEVPVNRKAGAKRSEGVAFILNFLRKNDTPTPHRPAKKHVRPQGARWVQGERNACCLETGGQARGGEMGSRSRRVLQGTAGGLGTSLCSAAWQPGCVVGCMTAFSLSSPRLIVPFPVEVEMDFPSGLREEITATSQSCFPVSGLRDTCFPLSPQEGWSVRHVLFVLWVPAKTVCSGSRERLCITTDGSPGATVVGSERFCPDLGTQR